MMCARTCAHVNVGACVCHGYASKYTDIDSLFDATCFHCFIGSVFGPCFVMRYLASFLLMTSIR